MFVTRRALLLAPLATPAFAQGTFPDRPIRLVIGYPAGGGVDVIGRPIMQRLSERLGQPVVVENRGGANGNIAMEFMARVEPDGHMLFMGDAGNLGIAPCLKCLGSGGVVTVTVNDEGFFHKVPDLFLLLIR